MDCSALFFYFDMEIRLLGLKAQVQLFLFKKISNEYAFILMINPIKDSIDAPN
ncbi:hypothetical protein RV10_GL000810 [Enterococcus pallens]|nr:hypothetical protein RV10_GL000810 [Enterococcus pallens]